MHLRRTSIYIASLVVAVFLTNAALSEEKSKTGEVRNQTEQPYEEVADRQEIERDAGDDSDAGVSFLLCAYLWLKPTGCIPLPLHGQIRNADNWGLCTNL